MSSVASLTQKQSGRGLTASNSVATVARRICQARHSRLNSRFLKAGVACQHCWDTALEADLSFAMEAGLPLQPPRHDPSDVDEVAVERALAGEPINLTPAEQAAYLQQKNKAVGGNSMRGFNEARLCGQFKPNMDARSSDPTDEAVGA